MNNFGSGSLRPNNYVSGQMRIRIRNTGMNNEKALVGASASICLKIYVPEGDLMQLTELD